MIVLSEFCRTGVWDYYIGEKEKRTEPNRASLSLLKRKRKSLTKNWEKEVFGP